MAGILDSKKRIMDTLVLPTGRAQAFDGHMRFRYVTLTDRHTFYESTGSNGLGQPIVTDASERIFFEAVARPQDLLCPETDLNAKIVFPGEALFQNSAVIGLAQSDIITVEGVFPTDDADGLAFLDATLPAQITQAMTASYLNQHFLASEDPIFGAREFVLSKNQLKLNPFASNLQAGTLQINDGLTQPNLNTFPAIWEDPVFSLKPNFQFLPPINKLPPTADIRRILPWITANMDLKAFSFADYIANWQDVLEGEVGAAGYAMFDIDEKGTLHGVEHNVGFAGFAPPEEMVGSYTYAEMGHHMLATADSFNSLIAVQFGGNENKSQAMYPIIASGGQLNKIDFAVARACFMGVWDVSTIATGDDVGNLMSGLKQSRTVKGFIDKWKSDSSEAFGAPQASYDSFTFDETSRDNNIAIQVFEFQGFAEDASPIKKLTMVRARTLAVDIMTAEGASRMTTADLYYVGKLFWPPGGGGDSEPRFIKLFSILLCDEDLDLELDYGL